MFQVTASLTTCTFCSTFCSSCEKPCDEDCCRTLILSLLMWKKKEEVTVYFPEGQTEPLTATSIEGLCISEAAWGRMYPCLYVSKRSSTVLNRIPHSCVNKIPYNKLISLPRTMKMPLAEFSECAFSPLCQQMPFRCSERDRFWKCRRCLLTSKLLIYWIGTLLFHFNNS